MQMTAKAVRWTKCSFPRDTLQPALHMSESPDPDTVNIVRSSSFCALIYMGISE